MVIWLIGMSGAGKTSIGKEVYRLLKAKRPNVVFLDGDAIRHVMGNDLGHTIEDRKVNADRICRFCKFLDDQRIDTVCAVLSIFHESQQWNRKNIQRYFEVYIRVPSGILLARNPKGLYRQALDGKTKNVVGVDIPFSEPENPDLIIDNIADVNSFEGIAKQILNTIPWENY